MRARLCAVLELERAPEVVDGLQAEVVEEAAERPEVGEEVGVDEQVGDGGLECGLGGVVEVGVGRVEERAPGRRVP